MSRFWQMFFIAPVRFWEIGLWSLEHLCSTEWKTVSPLETGNIQGTSGYHTHLRVQLRHPGPLWAPHGSLDRVHLRGSGFQGTGFPLLILWRQTFVTLRQEIEESLKKKKSCSFVLNALPLWVFLDYLLNKVQCLLLSIWGVNGECEKHSKLI